MKLTAENTAIVLDSTSDLPDAHGALPELARRAALCPLRRARASATTSSSSPEEFYARLRRAPELPTTSQPAPGDFAAAYEELGGFERILSVHISGRLSGTVESARAASGGFPTCG